MASSNENVVNLNSRTPRATLERLIDLLDEGVVSNFVLVAQGYDEENERRVMVPMVAGTMGLSDICVAAAVLDEYKHMSVVHTLSQAAEYA